MELRDYIRMLKRGWPVIVLVTALVVSLSALYITVAPKSYEASTMLFVSGENPTSAGELSEGNSFALSAVTTYGKVIPSDAVLGPAGASLQPPQPASDLYTSVTAVVPEETTLIIITAAADDPQAAANLANAVAATSTQVLPALQANDAGRPLIAVQQLRPASPPSNPVSPDAKRVLALGLVVGLCLGLALTISAQTLDTRIRRADDVRSLTDVPLLAEVRHRKRRGQQHFLAVRDEPAGAAGEAYRTLRTNLGFMEPRQRRSLVFAAVTEDRNNAQVPANLAWSLAQAGWSVLLVDLDLRRSTIADTLGILSQHGLADVLLGKRNLPEVVIRTAEPHLRVVTAGTPQASPSDVLSGPAMNNLLRRMEQDYDYVILHAPPLLYYTDAALVARAAGGSVVTVAAGRTRAQELTTAMTALANVRIKPAGLVLAGIRRVEGLGGLVGGGLRTQAGGSAASVASGLQPPDPGRVTPSTSPKSASPKSASSKSASSKSASPKSASPSPSPSPSQSPSQSTLRMMPPAQWATARPPGSSASASARPRPSLRPSPSPLPGRATAVQPVTVRRDPEITLPAPVPPTAVPWVAGEAPAEEASVDGSPVGEWSVEQPSVEPTENELTLEESTPEEPTLEESIEEEPAEEEPAEEEPAEEEPSEESSAEEPFMHEPPEQPERVTPPPPETPTGSDERHAPEEVVVDDTVGDVVRPGRPL